MAPVMGVSSDGGEYEGGGSAGVVEKGLVDAAGRRVDGEGSVKVVSNIFADVELEGMFEFL